MHLNSQPEGFAVFFFQVLIISCSLLCLFMVLQVLWSCRKPPSSSQPIPGFWSIPVPMSAAGWPRRKLVSCTAPWKAGVWDACSFFFLLASVCCTMGPQSSSKPPSFFCFQRPPDIWSILGPVSALRQAKKKTYFEAATQKAETLDTHSSSSSPEKSQELGVFFC